MKNKAVFIDRDGVINKLILKNGEETSPKSVRQFEIYPYVSEAINKIKSNNLIIVITNQPDIARGKLSIQELSKINSRLNELIEIDDIFVCMHDDVDNCDCRKPKPGLIFQAVSKWDVDLKNSIVIGDSWRDMLAGKAAGIKTCYINRSSSIDKVIDIEFEYDFEAKNLLEAVNNIYVA